MSIDAESVAPSTPSPTAAELLRAWWQAGEPEPAEQLLTRLLIEHATPTIKAVIAYRLRAGFAQTGDAEDVCQEVTLQLIARLKYLKATGAPPLHGAFSSYVAAVAHQACSLYRRRQLPRRARLKDQLRYVLTHQRGLALWESAHKVWWGGFAVWREQRKKAVVTSRVLELQEDAEHLELPAASLTRMPLAELLAAVFNHLRGPIEFTALVNLVGVLLGIKDDPSFEAAPDETAQQSLQSDNPAERVEQRLYLQRLWQELVQLPLPERMALLLNLHDAQDRGLVQLLVELQITSLHQLAEVLGLAPLDFAELWRELPCADARIATMLGLTRQQVINLRSSARRHLASRMRAALGGK